MSKRIIFYYQAYMSLDSLLSKNTPITHLHLGAINFDLDIFCYLALKCCINETFTVGYYNLNSNKNTNLKKKQINCRPIHSILNIKNNNTTIDKDIKINNLIFKELSINYIHKYLLNEYDYYDEYEFTISHYFNFLAENKYNIIK